MNFWFDFIMTFKNQSQVQFESNVWSSCQSSLEKKEERPILKNEL